VCEQGRKAGTSTARDSNAAERPTSTCQVVYLEKIVRRMISKQFVEGLVFSNISQRVLALGSCSVESNLLLVEI